MKKFILINLLAFTIVVPSYTYASVTAVNSTFFATGAQMIDFETGVSQRLPTIEGVRFIQELKPSNFDGVGSGGLFGFQGFSNIVVDPYGTPDFSDLAIEFDRPISAAGAWVGNIWNFLDLNAPLVSVSVFDKEHNLLAERDIDLLASVGAPVFLAFATDADIGRIEWRGLNSGFFAVDNLVFTSPLTVPIPPAWLFLLSGLMGIYRLSKQKTRAQ